GRYRSVLGVRRADEQLRVRRHLHRPAGVLRLTHELAVDVERVRVAGPRRRDLMPLAVLPVRDGCADAALVAGVVGELEAEEVDVLDHLELAVANLEKVRVVLVTRLPARLEPERHRPAAGRDLA